MTTYKIQLSFGNRWFNYDADDTTDIEFMFLTHAVKIAKILKQLYDLLTDNLIYQRHWRIIDSHGNYFDLNGEFIDMGKI